MSGPSLEAIRKFKLKCEQEKREQDERRIKEKLSTLEHRAAQGDRKAKVELKKIEKVKEERSRPPVPQNYQKANKFVQNGKTRVDASSKSNGPIKRAPRVEVKFEDLMDMAKHNNNEIRRPEEPKAKTDRRPIPKKKSVEQDKETMVRTPLQTSKHRLEPVKPKGPMLPNHVSKHDIQHRPQYKGEPLQGGVRKSQPPPSRPPSRPPCRQPPARPPQYRSQRYYDDDEYEDDYESDGFVVDDDDDDVQNEVSRTIRSVFHYDRRRCDLREEELDRQYRQIGRVSTFEDLEREERRASKLAAQEDARAQKEEEERKRKKKLRLNRPEGRFYD